MALEKIFVKVYKSSFLTHFSINSELAQLREGLRGVLNIGTLMDMHPAAVVKMLSPAHVAAITMN